MAQYPRFQSLVRERYQRVHKKRISRGSVSLALNGDATSHPVVAIAYELLAEREAATK